MVECTCLENRSLGNRTVSSNLTPSALKVKFKFMAQDLVLNQLLKEVWKIDEKITSGETLTEAEKEFYNTNIPTILKYYQDNSDYWNQRKPV